MKKFQASQEVVDFSKLCAAMSNTTRIAILEKVANSDACIRGDLMEMREVSKFTVGQNVKQLAKLGLINSSFTKKTMSYCINYEKLEVWKKEVDELYKSWIKNKSKVNPTNAPCSNEHCQ